MRRALLLLTISLFAGCGPANGAVSFSTFDADDEGWTLTGDAERLPDLRGEGGNPTGTICGSDKMESDVWYFVAPPKFLGDVARAYGSRLTFDLKTSSTNAPVQGRDVVLQGPGESLVFTLPRTPSLDWTPFSVVLTPSGGWRADGAGTGPLATEAQLKGVLKNLSSLRIRGEYVDGPDTACIDNIALGLP